MTKADIVEKVQTQAGLSRREAIDMVESVLSLMKDTLESGKDITISGFGKFVVKHKRDRNGRNPQTGEAIVIDARRVITFKLSPRLREAINA